MTFCLYRVRLLALCVAACAGAQAGVSFAADATAPVAGTRPAVTALTADPAAPASAEQPLGSVAELMKLLHDGKLVELRTTYNGSYGASLLFYPDEMTYYAALFQDRQFWRVIPSQEKPRAEMIYANFVARTVELADVEIQRTELAAQKAFLERVIALSEDRAKRLQADVDVAHARQAEVLERQRATRDEAQALDIQKRAAQAQLRELQQQVQKLQQQTETGLSAPTR
jgi:hypothetical protein